VTLSISGLPPEITTPQGLVVHVPDIFTKANPIPKGTVVETLTVPPPFTLAVMFPFESVLKECTVPARVVVEKSSARIDIK